MAVGYAISRRAEGTRAEAFRSADVADTAVLVSADSTPDALAVAADSALQSPEATAQAVASPPVRQDAVVKGPASAPRVTVPDTGRWEFAVATTWVRVRSAPTPEGDVLRMVDSAQRVRLGPPMNGWRPVRVGVDRGWVDPRFFRLVPAPRP